MALAGIIEGAKKRIAAINTVLIILRSFICLPPVFAMLHSIAELHAAESAQGRGQSGQRTQFEIPKKSDVHYRFHLEANDLPIDLAPNSDALPRRQPF
jgi:hypothetical protein